MVVSPDREVASEPHRIATIPTCEGCIEQSTVAFYCPHGDGNMPTRHLHDLALRTQTDPASVVYDGMNSSAFVPVLLGTSTLDIDDSSAAYGLRLFAITLRR